MRVGIVGAGALGTLFGQRLAAQNEVLLLERKREVVDAIARDGLRVDGVARPARAFDHPRELFGVQILFVFVRATDTLRALRPFAAKLSPSTVIVSLQNGLGNEEAIKAALGSTISLVVGATTEQSLTTGPGEAKRIGEGTSVLGGAGASPETVNRIVRLLADAGFSVNAAYDIRPHLWGKLIANAAINPVAALLERPNGIVLSDEYAGEVARSLAQEAATVANAMRIPLPFTDPWSYVRSIVEQSVDLDNSMLNDLRAGARTEIDFINGAVVAAGRRAAVPTPYNETLTALVKAREGQR
jgi:2-dehydropantoate 2-reductase